MVHMKHGISYKNFTDAIVLIGAIIAVVSILLAFLAFKEPKTIEDPKTGEDIKINSVWEDPTTKEYITLAVTFAITALIGFALRRWYIIPVAASVASLIVSMMVYANKIIEYIPTGFVFIALIGLAGNIIFAVLMFREEKEKSMETAGAKKKAKIAAKK